MDTYLVTGGAGFIGSHLCDELIKNNKVYVLDNLSSGCIDNLPQGVELVEGDVRDYSLVESMMSKVDGCFHLAAIVSVPLCNDDWLHAHQVNLTGTLNIIESANALSKRAKLIPIVFASSSAVYGDSQALPNEESGQTIPISMYAASKLCSEYYGRFANEIYKIPFTALRLFNVYGTRQTLESSYSGVISIFLNALLHDQPCVFYGDGKQSRDFVFVKDVVSFFIQAMKTSTDRMRVYNVCSGKGVEIQTIAELLSQTLKKRLNIEYKPSKIGDIRHSLGSPLLAKNELDRVVHTSIKSGLDDLITSLLEGVR